MITPFHDSEIPKRLLGLTLALALGACTNIKNDSARTTTEGGLVGAAGGALVGAGAGAAFGGKKKSQAMLTGAAVGAVAGGAIGTAYGASVAGKKAEYTRTEDGLDQRLKSTQREIADRHTFNLGLQYEIARHEQRLASVRADTHSTALAVEQFELRSTLVNRIDELKRRERAWQATIDAHKAALREASGDPRVAAMRSQIDQLAAEQSDLKRKRRQLDGIAHRAQ